MALTSAELTQLVDDLARTDPFRTWRQRDDQMHYRALYVKKDYQLIAIRDGYVAKLARLADWYQAIRNGQVPEVHESFRETVLDGYRAKIERLALKYRDTLTEIRGRALAQFDRNPIGTTYYIDLDSGSDSNDGLSISTPWLTVGQYTTTTVRSAGDIAKIRAGTSQVPTATIVADEDGTYTGGLIELRGCTSLDDPWGDGSNVRPLIDFNGGNYALDFDSDYLWGFYNLEVKGSAYNDWNTGQWGIYNPTYTEVKNCKVTEARHATNAFGLLIAGMGHSIVEDSIFEGNRNVGLRIDQNHGCVRRSTFNGGGTYSQDVGLNTTNCEVVVEESSFGQTTAHDTQDIQTGAVGLVNLIGCTTRDLTNGMPGALNGQLRWEKHTWAPTGSLAANGARNGIMTIERQTSVVRTGGSDFALKMVPYTNNLYPNKFIPSGLCGLAHDRYPVPIYLAAGTHTITMYARATEAFTTYPTAEELFLEAVYLDEASGSSLARAVSSQVLSDASTWVGLSVTITTGQAGHVFCNLRFGKWESAGKGIYVDPNPVLS